MLNKKKNNKGFTLVELLVVIAIIGILAVVAVPALFKNINKAKVADLQADYNAIKSATLSYYADENKLPTTGDDKTSGLSNLSSYMDSVPQKSSLGEGTYTLSEEKIGLEPNKSLFLAVGEHKLACTDETQEHQHDEKCFSTGEGITLTKDQSKKLKSDMGDLVYVKKENESFSKITDTYEGSGVIVKIKLIDNTSSAE